MECVLSYLMATTYFHVAINVHQKLSSVLIFLTQTSYEYKHKAYLFLLLTFCLKRNIQKMKSRYKLINKINKKTKFNGDSVNF